ncbi:SMP-30/gluconolactonase/LRE family protein [Hymenobacter arizonensis]|uniref:Regucalcin n=1 Tax=Hymenobacter arizonensis TaxID=1227077 RepID=A0A1I5ZVE9_HYMAR|nr:SMP-30/gluconolactonase/LRE family protein [Hymenobacter arizonensis]SFQ60438.1 Sugar lactone lactonase YvrE [Hymenobacter arizonensis]
MEARSILHAQAALGEGALWNPESQQLYWVDIEGRAFHSFDPATQQDVVYTTGARVGTVVPMHRGCVLLALQTGIHRLDLGTRQLTLLENPLTDPGLRFNDGKCDPAGRFWVGTFDLHERPHAGALYRFDPDGSLHVMLREVTNSNGIVWSLDQRTMYYVDSHTCAVRAFDYDNASGNIENGRVIVHFDKAAGVPDGMTIDAEGKLWVAVWGSGTIQRFDPSTGALLQSIDVPAPHTSSCAFGGPDLRTLYITTARQGLSEEQMREFPLSGNLFVVEPGVSGVPASFFEGK